MIRWLAAEIRDPVGVACVAFSLLFGIGWGVALWAVLG